MYTLERCLKMNIYRAIASCPICDTKEEVWNYKGKFVPTNNIECVNCKTMYPSNHYLISFLELKNNNTISTSIAKTKIKKSMDKSLVLDYSENITAIRG